MVTMRDWMSKQWIIIVALLASGGATQVNAATSCAPGPHQPGTVCYQHYNPDTRDCNYWTGATSSSGGGGSGGVIAPPEACQTGGGTTSDPAPPYVPPVEVILAGTVVTYYHNDPLGSPLAATDGDGNVVWKEDYKPYGARVRNEEAAASNKQWFTGKPHEEEFGLSYFGARWYDPATGRFMGVDPVGVDPGNIHSFNRYAYGNNNPYKYVDPDGRASMLAFFQRGLTTEQAVAVGQMGNTATEVGGASALVVGSVVIPGPEDVAAALVLANSLKVLRVPKSAKDLKPTLIQENPRNLIPTQTKAEMSGSQVKRLTKDMKQNGFDQSKPVDARRNPNTGRLEIQDGHHRTEAARKAGLDKIPVQVWE